MLPRTLAWSHGIVPAVSVHADFRSPWVAPAPKAKGTDVSIHEMELEVEPIDPQ